MQASVDAALVPILSRPVASVPDVIGVMRDVVAACPDDDGLKWFTWLYLQVTEEIWEDCKAAKWGAPRWLEELDVDFARRFFDGMRRCIMDQESAPLAWRALHDRRYERGISRVQFGLAGMNAHINRDLALSVLAACDACGVEPLDGSPEHADFIRINRILDYVEIRAMQRMATGIIKRVADAVSPYDRIAAMAVVSRARDLAWTNAKLLRRLDSWEAGKRACVLMLDAVAARIGRVVLVPTERRIPLIRTLSIAA